MKNKTTSLEDHISSFCNSLGSFCNHLHFTSNALKQSIDRRPIPLDSASSTFVQCLNRRVSTATSDLDLLDSMSFGTVSFEELLGHCNELYKKHQTDLVEIEERLKSYGYVPVAEVEEEEEEEDDEVEGSKLDSPSFYGSLSVPDPTFKSFEEEDALLDESLSLKKLGLSDACLASLASEVSSSDAAGLSSQEPRKGQEFKQQCQPIGDKMVVSEGKKFLSYEPDNKNLESAKSPSSILKILESDFECLPGYIKGLASWEDLLVAVDKINSSLSMKTTGNNFFHQDEIPSFDLGPKARSYLLLLVRMNRLVVETIDGLISYKIL